MSTGITMMGVSEAMNLGASLGMDPKLLAEIINTSTGLAGCLMKRTMLVK
jgi:3-hydroxyisobutyrate dehydrogenase